MSAKFPLGQLLATPGVLDAVQVSGDDMSTFISRHASGDWGVIDAEDKRANEQALKAGARLFSAYLLKDGTKVWVITEANRAATTVLLPDEY